MKLRIRNLVLALFVCSFMATPAVADHDARPSGGMVALDLLVRPACVFIAVGSTAFFIGTMPLTVPMGVSHDAAYLLMAAPWRFTAGRPIGDFKHYIDGRDVRGFARETPRQVRAKRRAL